ncbi:MAG: methyltransferase domain-containing protein [Streptosporangiales bacterium]|nr:methyltransferase domain-containing protein [Streptosporangiales bacterium]
MSARLQAVVDQLDLRPHNHVLEIGCGHGVAATMVCERLDGGRLTGIDRSAKMIEAAVRRNTAAVAAGKAEFLVMSLEDLDLGDRRFDVIFAVRVGRFTASPNERVPSWSRGSGPAAGCGHSSTHPRGEG